MNAILLADPNHPHFHEVDFFQVYSDYILEQLQENVELDPKLVHLSRDTQNLPALQHVMYIFSNWGMPEIDFSTVCELFPNLKAIFYAGGDVSPFAMPFYQKGVRIFSTGSANAVPASEYTVGQILLATKGIQRSMRFYRDPASYDAAREFATQSNGNYQSKIGIIGMGRVGSRVAELLRSFQMSVFVADPYVSPQKAAMYGVKLTEMNDIFETCDVISCHLPSWHTLRHIIGYKQFSRMMPHSTFINAAQDLPIDEQGLIRAFRECETKTAILDTTSVMPLPDGHPLFQMKNIFITPHIAGSFGGELERLGQHIVLALHDYINDKPSVHEILRDQVTMNIQ